MHCNEINHHTMLSQAQPLMLSLQGSQETFIKQLEFFLTKLEHKRNRTETGGKIHHQDIIKIPGIYMPKWAGSCL